MCVLLASDVVCVLVALVTLEEVVLLCELVTDGLLGGEIAVEALLDVLEDT